MPNVANTLGGKLAEYSSFVMSSVIGHSMARGRGRGGVGEDKQEEEVFKINLQPRREKVGSKD